jgi:hypothetical protein
VGAARRVHYVGPAEAEQDLLDVVRGEALTGC